MKPLTPNMKIALEYIQRRHEQTGQPVTHSEMVLAGVLPSGRLLAARVGLLERGLIRVPVVGTAAWVPVEAR